MKKHHYILTHFILAGSLAIAMPAGAQPNLHGTARCGSPMRSPDMPGVMEGMPLPPFLHGLNLSDNQRDRIFDLIHAQAPTKRDQAKVIHKTQIELHRLSMSGEYSEAKAKALSEVNAQSMAVMAQMHARTDNQIYQILTPEQRKQVEEQKTKPQWIGMP